MSKRFGRNQKRAMRKQMAELENKVQHLRSITSKQRSEKRVFISKLLKARRTLELVAEVLGPNFVGLEPPTIEVSHIPDYWNIPKLDTIRSYDWQLMDHVAQEINLIETNRLTIVDRPFMEGVSIRLTTKEGDIAFGLSQELWHKLNDKTLGEVLHREISHILTKSLINRRNNKRDNRE